MDTLLPGLGRQNKHLKGIYEANIPSPEQCQMDYKYDPQHTPHGPIGDLCPLFTFHSSTLVHSPCKLHLYDYIPQEKVLNLLRKSSPLYFELIEK